MRELWRYEASEGAPQVEGSGESSARLRRAEKRAGSNPPEAGGVEARRAGAADAGSERLIVEKRLTPSSTRAEKAGRPSRNP